ncbi:hypothetical protein [Brevundimonas goettingensis]|uniref:Uncharacterized protein n=1 Tax=Brevundimonas goettingensis TaxID=2774190 RepID=A0A975GWW7_9CAUL|nr:hypothetical protein [Brevundimonas goettingensis]QTC92318.1 hypothetical protein IFJ75_05340 [Brevundimonas goettingensis]
MIALLSSLAGAALLTAAAGQDASLAPFEGEWNTSAAGCADLESQHGLAIEGGKIGGYEWGGDVVSVRLSPGGEAAADLDWWDINETGFDGRLITHRKTWGFALSSDHRALTVRFDDGSQTYVRCPGDRPG